jgi:superfamily II DNA or RNA helicase
MGFLTTQVSYEVDRVSQSRGRAYFQQGAVDLIEGDASRVEATVQGTRRYRVFIARKQDSFEVACTCPYYDRELLTCKHIWATFLAAEQKGYLIAPGEATPVFIEEKQPLSFSDPEPEPADWKKQLQDLHNTMLTEEYRSRSEWSPERELAYLINVQDTLARQRLTIEVAQRERKMDGSWGKLKPRKARSDDIARASDPRDREILAILLGAGEVGYGYSPSYHDNYSLGKALWEIALPIMCATGRCFLRGSSTYDELKPVRWDSGDSWEFCLKVAPEEGIERYVLTAALRRAGEEMELAKPDLLLSGGLVFSEGQAARLQDFGAFGWISLLRKHGSLSIPKAEADNFLSELLRLPRGPRLDLPEELKFEKVCEQPRPCLRIATGRSDNAWRRARLTGELSFEYDREVIPHKTPGQGIYQAERRRLILRDVKGEMDAEGRLKQLGFRRGYYSGDSELELPPDHLPKVVRALTNEGWHVEAEGKLYRTPGRFRLQVSSGVDWFELHGGAQFGEAAASVPELLMALKRGEHTVRLDDGTLGILPEEWMKKYGLLAGLATPEKDHMRFTKQQVGLLDALLASEPEATADSTFERLRRELYSFAGVQPADPPVNFCGKLRGYQREGLGWLYFLQRFGFGGCLADDMGLGKTVQVLALLEARRELRAGQEIQSPQPSLVVVPRSLVFHWKSEAGRFTPKLRILDHTGAARLKPGDHFSDYDLVITTYGTLSRDALHFKNVRFDYCILDEAQAIKNPGTLSAKAARLLGADHRLALSGTPVENHLGELWSLFEFLNPGMLGSVAVFGRAGHNPDENTRSLLARALRPFILRRTKEQVAPELPAKTEQTIYCDLEPREKSLYDELRAYYRARLLKSVETQGMSRAKFQVLEALLRLRQASCHPGLVDKARKTETSAKIDILLAQLDQVLEEGHKVLVFSQFTSLLAIVRERLDKAGIPHAYLDGRTRDRQARVQEFQNDPSVKLFLISLKAGGLGLNLHAAEYVYLLDPWWNPAVETQAIDRAHRIGQTRHVFAYRLIARDTVEEKVLELQKTKRDLADAIITADNSLLHNLTREDLELLLS